VGGLRSGDVSDNARPLGIKSPLWPHSSPEPGLGCRWAKIGQPHCFTQPSPTVDLPWIQSRNRCLQNDWSGPTLIQYPNMKRALPSHRSCTPFNVRIRWLPCGRSFIVMLQTKTQRTISVQLSNLASGVNEFSNLRRNSFVLILHIIQHGTFGLEKKNNNTNVFLQGEWIIFYCRQYRYETLLALESSLQTELVLMNELAIKHLKTYQVWHHRRLLITHLGTPQPELQFIERCLRADSKNYHTWSYRQWLLSHFVDDDDLWRGELEFIENAIGDDVRNNSAWHHRYFVVFGCSVRSGDEDRARIVRRELMYVFPYITTSKIFSDTSFIHFFQLHETKHLSRSKQPFRMELPPRYLRLQPTPLLTSHTIRQTLHTSFRSKYSRHRRPRDSSTCQRRWIAMRLRYRIPSRHTRKGKW
jgi:hypothetical protein